MAKIDKKIYEMLKSESQSIKTKLYYHWNYLVIFPLGIGDHSTKDFWDNATEAFKIIEDQ